MNWNTSLSSHLHAIAPKHLDRVLALDALCLGGIWSQDAYERELDSPNSDLLGITLSPTLVGFGCCWSIVDEAHITLLAIHLQYQGLGLGQFLLCRLLRAARDRHLERATLEVKDSNKRAISLYKKLGFTVAGRRPKYYPETGEDAVILWLDNLQSSEVCDRLMMAQREAELKFQQTYRKIGRSSSA